MPSDEAPISSTQTVMVALGGRLVLGTLHAGDAGASAIRFSPDGYTATMEQPRAGASVRMRAVDSDIFTSHAKVLEVSADGDWMLSTPLPLADRRYRRTPRVDGAGRFHLVTRTGLDWEMHDVSADGVGVLVPADTLDDLGELRLRGRLSGCGGDWEVDARSINRRPAPDAPGHCVMGFTLDHADETSRARLLQLIDQLSSKNGA